MAARALNVNSMYYYEISSDSRWKRDYPKIIQSVLNVTHINHLDKSGRTMLSFATELGSLKMIKFLLDKGADGNFKNWDGSKALHCSARFGHKDIAKFFLDIGVDVNSCDYDNRTPLMCAVLCRDPLDMGLVELFVESGANVDIQGPKGKTVLHIACEKGLLNLVKYLVRNGCDLDPKDLRGNTPLLRASYISKMYVVEYLVECGADVEYCARGGFTVLHRACGRGWLNVVLALSKKCNLNIKDPENGNTALHVAASNGQIEVVKYLLKTGVDCTIENNYGKTAFFAFIYSTKCSLKGAKLFIENGAYFRSSDYRKYSLNAEPLRDVNLCVQSIINGFNSDDLPKLYKIPVIAEKLPAIEKLKIAINGNVAQVIEQSVLSDINSNGFCRDVLDVRPNLLRSACVKSLLNYYNG